MSNAITSAGPKAGDLAFAYGSNTSLEHLEDWCRRSGYGEALFRPAGVAELPDAELAFNHYSQTRRGGALNLRRRVGSLVSGLLLRVGEGGWAALRHKEGTRSKAYAEVQRHAIGANGEATEVWTYVAVPSDETVHHAPAAGYVETVAAGYAIAGIDPAPLLAAAAGEQGRSDLHGLFVYGTLLRGGLRAGAIGTGRPTCWIGAEVPGVLIDLGSYPALILQGPESEGPDSATCGLAEGEFVVFDAIGEVLGRLDGIEGARAHGAPGGLYRRTAIGVGVGDGRVRRGWTYVQDHPDVVGRSVITSGSWRAHQGCREAAFTAIVKAHVCREPAFFERLGTEAKSVFQPDAPLPFALTVEGVAQALAVGTLSERTVARASGDWAVQTPRLAQAEGR